MILYRRAFGVQGIFLYRFMTSSQFHIEYVNNSFNCLFLVAYSRTTIFQKFPLSKNRLECRLQVTHTGCHQQNWMALGFRVTDSHHFCLTNKVEVSGHFFLCYFLHNLLPYFEQFVSIDSLFFTKIHTLKL